MLVFASMQSKAIEIAKEAARTVVGDPKLKESNMGPVVSQVQFEKIQGLISSGIEEGATLVCGGPEDQRVP